MEWRVRWATARRLTQPLARHVTERRLLLALLLVALLLRLLALGAFSTEYDEGVYWQSLQAMARGAPLYADVFSSQPPLFLLSLLPGYLVFGQSLAAARLTVALTSLLALPTLSLAGRALGGGRAGLLAAALLALDPLYLLASRTVQAEAPALALSTAAVAVALLAPRLAPRRALAVAALAGVLLAAAMLIKLLAVAALLPCLLYLLPPLLDGSLPWRERAAQVLHGGGRLALAFFAGAAAASAATLLPFLPVRDALVRQVVGFHLHAEQVQNAGPGANLALLAGTLLGAGTIVLALLAAAAVWAALRLRRTALVPILLWLAVTLGLLLRQQPLFGHHVVFLVPPLALLAALLPSLLTPALRLRAVERLRRGAVGGLALALLLAAILSGNALRTLPQTDVTRLQMAIALATYTTPTQLVVTDDQYVAGLAARGVPGPVVDTSLVRIATGSLTTQQVEDVVSRPDVAAVLFATGRLDRLPGLRAWVAQRYALVAEFGGGRALYLKQPPMRGPV